MVIPTQRLSDLESAAWQTDKRLDRIEANLLDLRERADQHGIALSATMQDLRDLRIDVGQMARVLDDHTVMLDSLARQFDGHTAMLEALVQHFGIEVREAAVAAA